MTTRHQSHLLTPLVVRGSTELVKDLPWLCRVIVPCFCPRILHVGVSSLMSWLARFPRSHKLLETEIRFTEQYLDVLRDVKEDWIDEFVVTSTMRKVSNPGAA